MKAFISHISEEAETARALKRELERAMPGLEAFASDIPLGDAWLATLSGAIGDAGVFLVLCSPRSVDKNWVNFESGAGWARHAQVITVCHDGLRTADIPFPLSMFQGVDLAAFGACARLVDEVAGAVGATVSSEFDAAAMLRAVVAPAPSTRAGIGVVLAHGQDGWSRGGTSVFDLADGADHRLGGQWQFVPVRRQDDLLSGDLHGLAGLVVGAPWRSRMSGRVVDAIVRWVRRGGRLLLLGYELGDRHHDGNLGDLARHFGIAAETDIVGPAGYDGPKPYGMAVEFDVADAEPHPELTAELSTVRLTNVQTLRVNPGGSAWLRVGRHVVCRPRRDDVDYRNGTLVQPGGQLVDCIRDARWVPVAVEAPAGLCGRGRVLALGTWQVLENASVDHAGTGALTRRLFDWLAAV